MTPSEIEVVLQRAFRECEAAGDPLSTQQREVLFRILVNQITSSPSNSLGQASSPSAAFATPTEHSSNLSESSNPLTALTSGKRQSLLRYIREQQRQDLDWKTQLMSDFLLDRPLADLQFVQDELGLNWIDQISPEHIAQFADELMVVLKVGDRIEVSNGLWEWVQDDGPCSREWFTCLVTGITEISGLSSLSSGYDRYTNCTIRFPNGMEYEIQGIYEWNRYNWRWAQEM